MTHVYFFWEDNETLHRTIPKDVFLVTEAVPREDTIAIGKDQTIDIQITANGKATIRVSQMRVGKVNLIKAYTELHDQGFAASVEVWDDETGKLVGGLYGVTIGKAFIGESMFSLVPSASKLALIFLARFLQKNGGKMIDCQLETPHLKSMGGRYISYEEYMKIMNEE